MCSSGNYFHATMAEVSWCNLCSTLHPQSCLVEFVVILWCLAASPWSVSGFMAAMLRVKL